MKHLAAETILLSCALLTAGCSCSRVLNAGLGLKGTPQRGLKLALGSINLGPVAMNSSESQPSDQSQALVPAEGSDAKKGDGSVKYVVIGGIMVVAAVVAVCAVCFCKFVQQQNHPDEDSEMSKEDIGGVPKHFCIDGVGILKVYDICLGQGSYGIVWEGRLLSMKGKREVKKAAVKEVWNHPSPSELPKFRMNKEASIILSCKHKNIVGCYGSMQNHTKDGRSSLICMELLPYTLNKLIHDDDDFVCKCKYRDLLEIFRGIAEGLQYLHVTRRVIHFDLNPRNVMMTKGNRPKISDFGVSRILSDGSVEVTSLRGTRPYIAPEVAVFAGAESAKHKVNQFVDMYSFGVLMWECVMRQKLCHISISRIEDPSGVTLYTEEGPKKYKCDCPVPLRNIIQRCLRFDVVRARYNIMSSTFASNSFMRPSTEETLKELEMMLSEPWADQVPAAWIESQPRY